MAHCWNNAHAKNYSLLLAGNELRFAPLYDVASALPYTRNERKLKLAMKIGGDYRIWPRRNLWPRAANELDLEPELVVERVRNLALRAPDAFSEAAKAPEVLALKRDLPRRLVDLIARRGAVCLEILDSPGPRARRSASG